MTATKTLYRPVGLKELELILKAEAQAFPPRLSWQPIFYPVLNFEYAAQIAKEWNTSDAGSGYGGFVTQFEVDAAYLSQFEVQNVGDRHHNELWIPSEQMDTFNQHIVGLIQITAAYFGSSYQGIVDAGETLKGISANGQLTRIADYWKEKGDLQSLVKTDSIAIQANYPYWKQNYSRTDLLEALKESWFASYPDRLLAEK